MKFDNSKITILFTQTDEIARIVRADVQRKYLEHIQTNGYTIKHPIFMEMYSIEDMDGDVEVISSIAKATGKPIVIIINHYLYNSLISHVNRLEDVDYIYKFKNLNIELESLIHNIEYETIKKK